MPIDIYMILIIFMVGVCCVCVYKSWTSKQYWKEKKYNQIRI